MFARHTVFKKLSRLIYNCQICMIGVFFLCNLFFFSAEAVPNAITFQARIAKPDGAALEASNVNFRLSILDNTGTCTIFQEDHNNKSMTGSKGLINLTIGQGARFYPSTPLTVAEVFNNYNSPLFNCQQGGAINASSTDRRKLILQFNDGSGWQTVPYMDINANPYALQASMSHKLGDYPAVDYLRPATLTPCIGGQALTFIGGAFSCVLIGGGSGTVTSVTSANADIGVATTTTTPVLTLNSGVGANQIVKLDGTAALPAVSGANLTNLNASNLSSGTVPAGRMPALTGDVTMAAGTTATTLANNAVSNVHVAAAAGIARSKLANGSFNHVLMNDGAGVMTSVGCLNGEILKWVAGVPTCSADSTGTGDVNQNGNSFAGAMTVGTNDNFDLNFETNGTQKMTVLANGNVGVGTAGPGAKLEVLGTATYNNSTQAFRVIEPISQLEGVSVGYDTTISAGFIQASGIGAGVWSLPLILQGIGGNVGIGITNPGNPLHLVTSNIDPFKIETTSATGYSQTLYQTTGRRYQVGAASPSEVNYNLADKFFVFDGTASMPRFVINSSGNVGIGTTTPGAKFEVRDTSAASVNGQEALRLRGHYSSATVGSGSTIDFVEETSGSTAARVRGYTFAAGETGLAFDTGWAGPTTKMVIDQTGRVGIGTTAPLARLHVGKVSSYADFKIGDDVNSAVDDLNGLSAVTWTDGSNYIDSKTKTGGYTHFRTGAATETGVTRTWMSVQGSTGNVGIGVLGPTYQLQLSTDSAAKPGTSTWTIASDERLKDIRAPFNRGLEDLMGLNTIYFNYKKDNKLGLPSEKEYVGIRAQDAQKVIPESVSIDKNGYLHVTNDSIIWTAVNAIKELYIKFLNIQIAITNHQREIATVKTDNLLKDQRIQNLEKENAVTKERLDKIEKILESR